VARGAPAQLPGDSWRHGSFGYAWLAALHRPRPGGHRSARLTSGRENLRAVPRFCAEMEKTLAYRAIDGKTEVHVMPDDGGVRAGLTYTATLARDDRLDRMGRTHVMTWRDNESVHLSLRRSSGIRSRRN